MKIIVENAIKQYFVILGGTIISTAVFCTMFNPTAVITIDYLWKIFLFCALADLPAFVYYSKTELSKNQWTMRTVLHTVLLEAVLLFTGKTMGMYEGLYDGIAFAVIVLLVDVLVRVVSYTSAYSTADGINKKIQERRKMKIDE